MLLLLAKLLLMLKIKPREMKWPLTSMLVADVFMMVTGHIGQQQLRPDGTINTGPHYL